MDALRSQSWSQPFNHNQHYAPDGETASTYYTHPYWPWFSTWPTPAPPVATGTAVNPIPGMGIYLNYFGWPQPPAGNPSGPSFNAVHMALIPKGPYRGHVLVFHASQPGVIKNPAWAPAQATTVYQSFQPYEIIDPADVPVDGIRFRNFLLPLGEFNTSGTALALDFFCSGHTWTNFGDLVVIGGTSYEATVPIAQAARATYAFNPDKPVAEYPGTLASTYPGFSGLWKQGDDLKTPRWYPTATRTLRLPRLVNSGNPLGRETILCVGGTKNTSSYTPSQNPTWNSYEALVINGEATATNAGYAKDKLLNPVTGLFDIEEWNGPGTFVGTTPQVNVDWFEEYPRCHSLSTRKVLFSGYAPRWSFVDHEFPGTWTRSGGQPAGSTTYSSTWQDVRHDGSSVLFPNIGGQTDVVVRFGGANEHWWQPGAPVFTTDSVESLQIATSPDWQAERPMPDTHDPLLQRDGGRFLANAVLLPTGGVLLVGGVYSNGLFTSPNIYVYKPQIFEGGDWFTYDENKVAGGSPRDYHSTAVLLPDGRVFLGGGNERKWDYEIFSPPYLNKPEHRPKNVTWLSPVPGQYLGAYDVGYNQSRNIQCDPLALGHAIEKVVFMAPGSVTHHSDMHQRYWETPANLSGPNIARFTTPATEADLPRGIYMLFLVTNKPSVSHAEWVVLQ